MTARTTRGAGAHVVRAVGAAAGEPVADELLASVQEREPGWESAWAEEAERRARAADAAGDRGRAWDAVKADLLAKLTLW